MCWDIYLNGERDFAFERSAFVNNHTSSSTKITIAKQNILSHDLIPEKFKSYEYSPSKITDEADSEVESHFHTIKETLLNPDFAPLMRKELQGLPETFIITCNFDVLRDDGIIYAKRLQDAAVEVTWKHYDDGVHGSMTVNHDGLFNLEAGIQMRRDLVEYLNETLIN